MLQRSSSGLQHQQGRWGKGFQGAVIDIICTSCQRLHLNQKGGFAIFLSLALGRLCHTHGVETLESLTQPWPGRVNNKTRHSGFHWAPTRSLTLLPLLYSLHCSHPCFILFLQETSTSVCVFKGGGLKTCLLPLPDLIYST